jgi:hypothetical protein
MLSGCQASLFVSDEIIMNLGCTVSTGGTNARTETTSVDENLIIIRQIAVRPTWQCIAWKLKMGCLSKKNVDRHGGAFCDLGVIRTRKNHQC